MKNVKQLLKLKELEKKVALSKARYNAA